VAVSPKTLAQIYSTQRVIKIIVPAAPAGINDTVARLLGDPIRRAQRQTILIENRAGADGAIGTEVASRATPPVS
jgi:tripartite-type tricarboxylate transporter receptor subunit TctC